MVPGVGGHLVAHAFLEQELLPLVLNTEREAIAAASTRIGRWWRRVERLLGPASGARAVGDVAVTPLLEALGHGWVALAPQAWGLLGMVDPQPRPTAVLLVLPWAARLDAAWREALRGGLATDARWALLCNGRALALADCTRPWTRRWVEFEFDALMRDARGPAVLWALAGAAALGPSSVGGPRTLSALVNRSEQHAAGVCHSLGAGVIEALPQVAGALATGHAPADGALASAFDQALTVVYRMLFLLFAEARGLVPVWHEVYREAYTIDALCRRAADHPSSPGLWEAFQAISRMAHAGCRAGDLEVTAFNGRLFAPSHAPLVEGRRLPDAVVRHAVTALSTTPTRHGRRRIAYQDLGVEQLGSVYERVLEYEPSHLRNPAPSHLRTPAPLVLTRTSTERKATGSFYTPRPLTEFLVRRTLHPLVEHKAADEILALRVVDPAMGSGAFLVAACRYLADQCEHALVREGRWQASEVTAADRAGLRRQVAERCLYGVDLNPTAVQLARLSLWLTTLASDRPLTFLDHHLAAGNSLVGAGLADLASPPAARRSARHDPRLRQLPLFDDTVAGDLAARILPGRVRLALEPSDTLEAVRRKEHTLAALASAAGACAQVAAAADVWCALGLWPGAPPSRALAGELLAGALGAATTLPHAQLQAWLARAAAIARSHAAFHWELAFPEVFFDERGRPSPAAGFDAVVGNPPWDMLRADEGDSDARERTTATVRFCRGSGRYACQGGGHPNRYQLFLERAWQLTRRGGRLGLVLPSGVATDHGSAALRRALFDRCRIDTWLGFDNRQAIFPIHRSVRFVLLTAAHDGCTDRLRYRCGLQDASVLDRSPSNAREDSGLGLLSVSRSRLEAWDPEHLTVPEFTHAGALDLASHASAVAPPLSSPGGWGVRFGRELNATDDRPHFVSRRPGEAAIPIIEGKHLSPFRVDVGAATHAVPPGVAGRLIDAAASFARARLAYRDVASATNRLTVIAAVLPPGTLSTHTVFCAKAPLDEGDLGCLLGLLNSLVLNYLARLHVTTHVTTALMARLPVPRPTPASPAHREIVRLSRLLEAHGLDHAPAAYASLNAVVAGLYHLSVEQYRLVVESFPLLPLALRHDCIDAYVQATETQRHREG